MAAHSYSAFCFTAAAALALVWAACSLGAISSLALASATGREIPGTRFMLGGLLAAGLAATGFAVLGALAYVAA